jgi:DnaJ-class molecular chaperone
VRPKSDATDDDQLSKKFHPDAPGGSAEKFHEINDAYGVLGDDKKR